MLMINLHAQYDHAKAVYQAALAAQPDETDAAFHAGVTDLVQQLVNAGMLRESPSPDAFATAADAAQWMVEAAANDRVTTLGPGALLDGPEAYAYAVAKIRARGALLPDGWPVLLREAIARIDAYVTSVAATRAGGGASST